MEYHQCTERVEVAVCIEHRGEYLGVHRYVLYHHEGAYLHDEYAAEGKIQGYDILVSALKGQDGHQGHEHGGPAHSGRTVIAVGEALAAQQGECRSSVGGADYVGVVYVDRGGYVGTVEPQVAVDGIAQDGVLGRVLLHYLDGSDYCYIVPDVYLYYIPGMSEVDISGVLVQESERDIEDIAVSQVMDAVP